MSLSKNDEQISFEDLDFDAAYEEEVKYTTISGKEYQDVHDWNKYGIRDLDVGEDITGIPEITYFENKDKKYDSLRFRVLDDGEFVDLYINIPKPDENGYVSNLRKSFDFYRTAFDFVYSVLKYRDERNVIDSNGEEINNIKRVNIMTFAKYVDQFSRVSVRITEGNESSDFDSFIILKME